MKKKIDKNQLKETQKLMREAEIEVLNAIRHGDLQKLESIKFNADGIDSRLSIHADTKVYPAISRQVVIESVCGPTVVVYSILCEQPEILKFFLSKFNPSLSYDVDGWTPLHFACATKDSTCLKILLSIRYVQQIINMPIVETTTTPIYIASLFGNHEHALLLTQPKHKVLIPSPVAMEFPNIINVSEQASTGCSALHIAVKNNDWDMCQILLSSNIDQSLTDSEGSSAYDIARNLKLSKIVEKFENVDFLSREKLEERYLNKETREEHVYFERVNKKIEEIKQKLGKIENQIGKNVDICSLCEEKIGKLCSECNQHLCETCWASPMHRCPTTYNT
ncbi:hypothetical protein TRFO_19275 [Tritrichomonas foetus]|uniref:B box-type domain-containing protein n=1 Tax=Tritrichomonas foetus TaxID=1144522 RepID=A0A1J4KJM7_9EUKA|nr:hypothetical protein TRFO_19275 [Tritrichomonas foetus]|eukprot:OHT11298.1 hypothetical protein TRFO_19275 [Tritrichomonas foetus]